MHTLRGSVTRRVHGIPRLSIKSATHYLEVIRQIRERFEEPDLWFRGVSKASYRLIPSIYRTNVWRYNDRFAKYFLEEFARRAKPFIQSHHTYNKWHWYHAMQHHGMPTRLLDWTTGSLIALYFATRSAQIGDQPAVYVLDPYWLDAAGHSRDEGLVFGPDPCFVGDDDGQILESFFAPRSSLPKYPLCIKPPHTDARVVAQKSVFTISGSVANSFEILSRKDRRPRLVQLVFARGMANDLRDELRTMGIVETSLFPDLEGLSREMKLDFSIRY